MNSADCPDTFAPRMSFSANIPVQNLSIVVSLPGPLSPKFNVDQQRHDKPSKKSGSTSFPNFEFGGKGKTENDYT